MIITISLFIYLFALIILINRMHANKFDSPLKYILDHIINVEKLVKWTCFVLFFYLWHDTLLCFSTEWVTPLWHQRWRRGQTSLFYLSLLFLSSRPGQLKEQAQSVVSPGNLPEDPECLTVPKYKRDLVQKLKILRQELSQQQPQAGHCRIEVSREEIFEVRPQTRSVQNFYIK